MTPWYRQRGVYTVCRYRVGTTERFLVWRGSERIGAASSWEDGQAIADADAG